MPKRNAFLVYHDQEELINTLSDKDAGVLLKAMIEYSLHGSVSKLPSHLELAFISIRKQIDRNHQKYDEKCKKNAENIKKRWSKEKKDDTTVYERIRPDTKHTNNKNKSKNKSKSKNKYKEEYKEWLVAFNERFDTRYSSKAPLPNYRYWRDQYSKDDLLEAIDKIPQHDWLRDKAKPDLVLRQRDTHGNSVDRIGELLSLKQKKRYL